jgi:molybdenum cofactor cytidylyltransferase
VISGIVLAAGSSTRMGRPKALLPLAGRPMLQHVLDAAEASPLDEVVVVLGPDAGEVWASLRPGPRTRAAVNLRAAEGQSTSLHAGLRAADVDAEAAVMLLGDQPEIRRDALGAVIEAFRRGRGPVVQAVYGGRPGHPVLFARDAWPDLEAATGDEGARRVVAASPGRVHRVEVGGDPPEDVDTEDDYVRIRTRIEGGGSG